MLVFILLSNDGFGYNRFNYCNQDDAKCYAPGEMCMNTKPEPPPIHSFMTTSLILIILGWGGLLALLNYTEPSGGSRWALFFFAVLGFTGLALPAVAFLNRRFPSSPSPSHGVIVRQALWLGIYVPLLAWLRIGRVLNFSLALLLIAGLILIEWLLRLRERSQWKPEQPS
jgi:hypothetical protein